MFLCSGFPTQLLVFQALTYFGMSSRAADGGWSPPFIVAMALIDMVLVLLLVWLFLRAHREPVAEFVLGPRRPGREVLLGLALIPAAFLLVVVVLAVILRQARTAQRRGQSLRAHAADAARRGDLRGGRDARRRGPRRSAARLHRPALRSVSRRRPGRDRVYSVVFGLGHIEQGYAAAIATGSLGAAWGVVYWRRQSIIAPMVSHAGFNLAQLLKYVSFGR